MNTIHRNQLPVSEEILRADLSAYHQALVAHRLTIGIPAPLPAYDLLGVLDSGFVVEDDPVSDPEPIGPATAEQNKATAVGILDSTDWITIADVINPTNSPCLGNQAEFIAYRNEIRKIAVNPVSGDLVWTTKPMSVWLQGE